MIKYYFNSKVDAEILYFRLVDNRVNFSFRCYESDEPDEYTMFEFVFEEDLKQYIDNLCTQFKLNGI